MDILVWNVKRRMNKMIFVHQFLPCFGSQLGLGQQLIVGIITTVIYCGAVYLLHGKTPWDRR